MYGQKLCDNQYDSNVQNLQEAQLSQRNRATRYVSKFVLCFTRYTPCPEKCHYRPIFASNFAKYLPIFKNLLNYQ